MPISTDHRPWGSFDVLLEADGYKVKRITVLPHQRLSLQFHHHRHEHWVVVTGVGVAVCGDAEVTLTDGEVIDIPAGAPHRMGNPGDEPLVFIEVQRGAYLGEDDIVRLADDYHRLLDGGEGEPQ